MIVPSILSEDIAASILYYYKYAFKFALFCAIAILVSQFDISDVLSRWLICIGVVLAFQSIVLVSSGYLGFLPAPQIVTRFSDDDYFLSYGILGYANWAFGEPSVRTFIRAQSFFSESTKFALFLFYPLLCTLGDYLKTKKIKDLLKSIVIILGFISAVSISGMIGLFLGIAIGIIYRKIKHPVLRVGLAIFIFAGFYLVFLPCLQFFHSLSHINRQDMSYEMTFAKGEGSLSVRIEYIMNVIKEVFEKPFGLSYIHMSATERIGGLLPLGFIRWLEFGGVVGFIIIIVSYFQFYPVLVKMFRQDLKTWALASGLLGYIITSMLHSNLFDFVILFYLIILSREAKKTCNHHIPITVQ